MGLWTRREDRAGREGTGRTEGEDEAGRIVRVGTGGRMEGAGQRTSHKKVLGRLQCCLAISTWT